MTWKFKHPGRVAGAIGGLLCLQLAVAQDVGDIYDAGLERIEQAQAQQDEIDAIADEAEDLFEEYQSVQREIEDLVVYNTLLQAQVNAQRRELDQLRRSIDEVGLIERQVLPLMTRMITGLERFIALDMPFLLEERRRRAATARATLSRSDVSVANQFRFVLEAWLIEMEDYGTTGELYTDEIVTPDGVTREVELLRVGRIALIYLTPDGNQAGAWDNEAREWVQLDPSWLEDIRAGFEAYRTETPALFYVPVSAPEEG
ncbi:MAG TPA: DUF3450 domain-containing protein [Gammaproteobacteria bacterium]|nr:DUF3450 domain-containing protein [Gammaproteobacteria bacterium]